MSRIAVFFDDSGFDDYPFDIEEYRIAYRELGEQLAKRGAEFFIVRGQESYLGNNRFSHGWKFSGSGFEEVKNPITMDVIYDKGHFQHDAKAKLLNPPELDALCTDKWKTYQLFAADSPLTFFVQNAADVTTALEKISTSIAVAKPVDGQEGVGVMIEPKEKLRTMITKFPYILSAFIDTKNGIPGIVDGPHDLRMVNINGQIGVSYVRTPPSGSLRANVAQGGKEIELLTEKIPAKAQELFTAVDAKLRQYPSRVYSVDMGLDRDGRWKLIELNSKPAVSMRSMGPTYPRFQDLLVDAFLAAV